MNQNPTGRNPEVHGKKKWGPTGPNLAREAGAERPDDLAEAWTALARHRTAHRLVEREEARLTAARR